MSNRQKTADDTINFSRSDSNIVLTNPDDEGSFPRAFVPHTTGRIDYDTPKGTGKFCIVNAGQEYHWQIKKLLLASVVETITGIP